MTALRWCLLICRSLLSELHLWCKQRKQPPGLRTCACVFTCVCLHRGRDGNKAVRLLEDRVEVHKIPIGKIHTEQVESVKRDISQTCRLRMKVLTPYQDILPQGFVSVGSWPHEQVRWYAHRVKRFNTEHVACFLKYTHFFLFLTVYLQTN